MAMTVPQMALPEVLPVFPLTGVMLLPGTVLPLHIFEPRYRAMIEDALDGDKMFGMIQPFAPQSDNRGPAPGAENIAPDLYKVGCVGYIEKWEKLEDGRFFVQLKGVNRFRLSEESRSIAATGASKLCIRNFPTPLWSKAGNAIVRRCSKCSAPTEKRTAWKSKRSRRRSFPTWSW